MRHFKLLTCEGEVARSAETEGFSRLFESNWQKNAHARQRTLPSRFAIHLPLAGKEPFTVNFKVLGLMYKDMLPRGGCSVCGFDKLTTLSLL